MVECLKFIDISAIARLCATDITGNPGLRGPLIISVVGSRTRIIGSVSTSRGIRKVDVGRSDDERSIGRGSAVAKLGLAAKALKAGSHETGKLLDAAAQLLKDEDPAAKDRAVGFSPVCRVPRRYRKRSLMEAAVVLRL